MSLWYLRFDYKNGRVADDLSKFWADRDDSSLNVDPSIPNLPLERQTGIFDTGIFDRNIFDNVLGPLSSTVTATASITLGAVTLAAAGTLPINATSSVSLGALTVASVGNLPIDGDAAITLGAVTLSSASTIGSTPITGDAAITLGAVTISAAGNLPIAATAGITLGTVTETSTGTLPIAATSAVTLGAVTISSASKLALAATSSITLGSVGLSSAGNLPIDADLAVTLGAVGLSATGAGDLAPINGTAAILLGDIILTARGSGPSVGSGFGGWAHPAAHRQGDTRWDGVREAREEARRLFDDVAATTPAKRKKAAARASEAVAKVAGAVSKRDPPALVEVGLAKIDEKIDYLLEDLLQLQAYLAGLAEQDRIAKAEARQAAERWAMIERELAAEAAREEELMVVMALAL